MSIQSAPANHSNLSAEKTLDIIELLADQNEPMRLKDIARLLGANASTTTRFLNTLRSRGYVAQESKTSRYYLTYKICRIANTLSSRVELQGITHPYLTDLSMQFNESACVSVEQGMRMVYIDVATDSHKTLMSFQKVGNTAPMHSTGNGKLLLTTFSESQIDRYIQEIGLKQYTQNTITSKEALLEELDKIRTNGYALDNEECETGVCCTAFPIYNYTNEIVAGISITGPKNRIDTNHSAIKKQLKLVSIEISSQLGYDAGNDFD